MTITHIPPPFNLLVCEQGFSTYVVNTLFKYTQYTYIYSISNTQNCWIFYIRLWAVLFFFKCVTLFFFLLVDINCSLYYQFCTLWINYIMAKNIVILDRWNDFSIKIFILHKFTFIYEGVISWSVTQPWIFKTLQNKHRK